MRRVAFVSGASGVLGAAVVRMLAERNVPVGVGYHHGREAAERLAASVCGDIRTVQVDVARSESVDAAVGLVERELGAITILVNAAGYRRDALATRTTDRDWSDVLGVNVSGAFYCARRVLPSMIAARWGRIVTIGSIAGQLGSPGQVAYATAKAALGGMTKTLSREVARKGVTVNVVSPGLFASSLTSDVSEGFRQQLLQWSATGEETSPECVAAAVGLCLDAPSLTGQVITVDAGIS